MFLGSTIFDSFGYLSNGTPRQPQGSDGANPSMALRLQSTHREKLRRGLRLGDKQARPEDGRCNFARNDALAPCCESAF